MSFSIEWLTMREPYDHAARSEGLARAFADALPDGARVVDLAGGRGSGARYLQRVLPADVAVEVVDYDEQLLADAAAAGLGTRCLDLRHEPVPAADAWHTQALLDLVSHEWLARFAEALIAARVPLLAALTVDGRVSWSPEDADDRSVQAAFRAHQRLDRGFGPSPGPDAAPWLAERLERAGWQVRTERADWRIPSSDGPMVEAMLKGTAEAARVTHASPERVDAWLARRLAAPPSLVVGHLDLLALPARGGDTG
jgi:hypothetical protein